MRTLWCVMLGCSLSACQAAEQPDGTGAADDAPTWAATSAPAAASQTDQAAWTADVPSSLTGEYRVAGIDGEPLNADFGIALSITEEQISYEPECAGFVWNYGYQTGTLATERSAEPARQADGSTLTCAVAVAPELRQLGQALDSVTSARRTPSNAIELSGGGRSATLFTQ